VSDASGGSGWWQASDGRWYPPELHPARLAASGPDQRATPEAGAADAGAVTPTPSARSSRLDVLTRIPSSTAAVLLAVVLVVGGIVMAATASSLGSTDGSGAQPGASAGTTTTPSTGAGASSTTTIAPSSPGSTPTNTSGGSAGLGLSVTSPGSAALPKPYTGSGPSGSLVNSTVEQHVVSTTWRGFSADMVANDLAGLSTYATSNASNSVRGSLLCGCSPWPMAYRSVAFNTPPEQTWPLSFLAEFSGINYSQKSYLRDVIFSQAASGAPWLVASTGTTQGASSQLFPGPSDITAPPSSHWLTTAPQAFANLFQQTDTTGSTAKAIPTYFIEGSFLRELIQGSESSHSYYLRKHVTVTFSHSVLETTPRFAVGTTSASTYDCFMMQITTTQTAPSGYVLVQGNDSEPYTAALPAGSYSSVHETELKDICLVELPTDGLVSLYSQLGGPTTITGTSSTGTPITDEPTPTAGSTATTSTSNYKVTTIPLNGTTTTTTLAHG